MNVEVKMSTENGLILELILSSNTNSFHIHQSACSLQGVHGATYSTPPFLFDLPHLSSAVPGSLLELPPQ